MIARRLLGRTVRVAPLAGIAVPAAAGSAIPERDELVEVAERFYRTLRAADPQLLLDVVDPAFRAEVTAGLPEGWAAARTGAREEYSSAAGRACSRSST